MKSMEYLVARYDEPGTPGFAPYGLTYYDSRVAEQAEQEAEEEAMRQERSGRRKNRKDRK